MSRGNLLHMDAHMKRLEARQVPGVTRPLNAEESAAVNSMNAQLASEQAIDAKWIHMFWHFTPKFMRTNPFQIPGV